jgi:hypothetical protein
MVVRAREGLDPCTDSPTVTGFVVVPLVTASPICRVTLVSVNVYPVGTTSGTCSCTKVAPEGMTKGADVPRIGSGGPPCILASNTPVTVPVVYGVHWVSSVMAHVPAVTAYMGSVEDEVKLYPLSVFAGMGGVDMMTAVGLGVCTRNPDTSRVRASTSSVSSNRKRASPPGCPGGPGGPRGPRGPCTPCVPQSVRHKLGGGWQLLMALFPQCLYGFCQQKTGSCDPDPN